jgi:hypothetical protein
MLPFANSMLPFAKSIRAMPAVMPNDRIRRGIGEIARDNPFAKSIRAMPAVMPSRSRNETGGLASILNSLRNRGIGQPTIDYSPTLPAQISTANPASAAASQFMRTGEITRDLPTAMTYDEAIGRNMTRDVKRPEVQAQIDAAIAAGPMQMTGEARRPANPFEGRNQLGVAQRIGESDEDYNIRSGLVRDPNRRPSNPFQDILSGLGRTPARTPANPFEGNEQYQALREYEQSLAPNQEQQQRLQELRSAFEGTGAYKDYQINQMQQQMRQMQQRPQMGMGLGGMNPMGMQPYQGFGRPQFPMQMPMQQPMRQFGAMGFNQQQPYQQQQQYGMMGGYGMSPYQQMRPQPQQFGGYGMGQQMGGYGGYGGMSNPYQPQQMGSYNPNNSMGYGQVQHRGMNQAGGFGQIY